MARFEITTAGGEKILVDHDRSAGLGELLIELGRNPFILFSEIRGGGSSSLRELIVAAGHITLVRPVIAGVTQGSDFRPKR